MALRGALIAALALVFLTIAGCVESDVPPSPGTGGGTFVYEDDRFRIEGINDTARQWVPTLQEPPLLALGEYWKIRVTSGFDGKEYEAYVVVAGQEGEHWLFGMPTHDFDNELVVYHLPGLGQVRKATLGFEAHDFWLDPVRFPIVEGDKWETGFMADGGLNLTVIAVDGLTATMEATGSYTGTIVYDAEVRGIRSMDFAGYAKYEVVEHGFDWHAVVPQLQGTVTVPHMSDLILCHGRLAGIVELVDCGLGTAGPPSISVDVDTNYDRVSFSLITLAIQAGGLPIPATYYQITASAPDGAVYDQTLTPMDGTWLKMTSYKHDRPGGTWDIEAVAAGAGQAFIEGIAYHVYDVELPSGRILPSIGEHQHGEGEGH